MKFTGVCTISSKSGNGTVVFKSGKRILAQHRDLAGDNAWNELQNITQEKVDASLSTLNEPQIQLSLEFNKTCLVVKGGKSEKSVPGDIPAQHPQTIPFSPVSPSKQDHAVLGKNHQKTGIPVITPSQTPVRVEPLRVPEPPKIISDVHLRTAAQIASVQLKTQIHPQKPDEKKTQDTSSSLEDSDSSSFEEDIETFETMDVEAIRNKIRGECKTLIKELNLEHLTDND